MKERSALDRFAERLRELNKEADEMINARQMSTGEESVDTEAFHAFRTGSLSIIKNIYGDTHSYYKDFDVRVHRSIATSVRIGRGIVKAIREEIDAGLLNSVKSLVAAEIFSDFLEMADHLLDTGYKDAAAVMIGSVLEEHLRQLCIKSGFDVEYLKDGKLVPKKADTLNGELASNNMYNKLDQKNITAWLDLRNKAAHGKYNEYTMTQVQNLISGAREFIARTS